jgi:hypothetical protein
MRCAGRLVIKRGNTEDFKSFGIGRVQRKSFPADGIFDEEVKSLLYVDTLEFACIGEAWGELYKAIIRRPRENMSAPVFKFESSTKSGEQ